MRKLTSRSLRAAALATSFGAITLFPAQPAAAQAAPASVIYLDQAWSQDDRDWYYNFSQGSTVMSYDIFLHLELADSQELFRSDANSERHGVIPQPRSPANPDGLPIGISKTVISKPAWKGAATGEFAGVTCAMCHTSELRVQGKRIRIDGGNNNALDYQAYIQSLDAAMQATLKDPAKFDRLASRLNATSADAKAALRKRFEAQAAGTHHYATRTLPSASPWGPARLDALTLIQNRLTSNVPRIPENTSTPNAPVKPPFLWNATQGLWTQWAAILQDPLMRNLGETMGVYLDINLHAESPAEGLFASNAAIHNLDRVEVQLWRLAPPSWPEDLLGKIDRDKAKIGKALFATHCASCHNMWPYRWTEPNKYGKSFVLVGLVPQSYVGTDNTQAQTIRPYALTGDLIDKLPGRFRGKPVLTSEDFKGSLVAPIYARAIADAKLTQEQLVPINGFRELPPPPTPNAVYKAAPRDGVWATPPFMHNGSVPNLYEMLVPASERTKKFYVGREFDPVKLGVDTSGNSGRFLFDTALLGNSNAGHSFENAPLGNGVIGPLLTDEQRWALIEYLKSIPETPGRVTPFGGPQQAATGAAAAPSGAQQPAWK
ncbi:di-heme-cytochrome C peroxidase [Pseudorhodoferax sp.]|uniref:di-heme-cytochrome C peroxidase n=1 Tax=Pseudorhodoferax sp. TaxID=1993553 RepID=UPI0039E247BB